MTKVVVCYYNEGKYVTKVDVCFILDNDAQAKLCTGNHTPQL